LREFPIQKWLFSAISASICGIPCAKYSIMYISAESLDFLDFAKNFSFLDWKLTSVLSLIYGWARDRGNQLDEWKKSRK
jgi:hypothetical protein